MTTGAPADALTLVVMASTPWRGHRLYEQRLATALGARHRVLYVEPPAHPFRAGTDRTTLPPGVVVVRPWTVPFGRRRALGGVTGVVGAVWVLARLGGRDRARTVVIAASMHPVTRRILSRLPTVALVKDDYVAGADLLGASADLMATRRRIALRGADRVVVVSPVLRDTVARITGTEPEVIPAGCDPHVTDRRLPEPAELHGVTGPRAVFIGLISDRIDFDFLDAAVGAGLTVVVVGGVQNGFGRHDRIADLEAGGSLVRVPSTSSERVRAFLEHCDVGLVPYVLSDFNRASFPLKTLEYLAAGLPVIGSDLPSLRWLGAPHVHLCDPAGVEAAWRSIGSADAAETAAACRGFAAENSWDDRARRYAELGRAVLVGSPAVVS